MYNVRILFLETSKQINFQVKKYVIGRGKLKNLASDGNYVWSVEVEDFPNDNQTCSPFDVFLRSLKEEEGNIVNYFGYEDIDGNFRYAIYKDNQVVIYVENESGKTINRL